MNENKIHRRKFLKKMSVGLTGASALAVFLPIQSAFAEKISHLSVNPTEPDSFAKLRDSYLLSPEIIYFNHGSIGTMPKIIGDALKSYLDVCESNPWLYMWSEPWEEARANTREKAAQFIGCLEDEVVLTHNTTEGFNLLANGLPLKSGDEVVFCSMNHAGASQCWFHYAETKGYSVKQFEFPITEVPNLSKEDIVAIYEKNISKKTRVLVFPHIDNLVGIRYPVKELAEMARRKGVQYIAVDGAQSAGMIPVNMHELGIDFYATSPHKWLQAPKGTGLLYVRKSVRGMLRPMWVTWGQRRWKDTVRIFEDYGTRNLAEIITLGNAFDYHNELGADVVEKRLKSLREHFYDAVENNPKIIWRSPKSWKLSTSIYTIEVKGKKSRDLFQELYKKHGYVFRPFQSENWNGLRISPNFYNTKEEMDRFLELAS